MVHPEGQVRPVSGIVPVMSRKPDELWRPNQGSQKESRYGKLEMAAVQIIQALEDAGCTLQLHCQSSPVTSIEDSVSLNSRKAGKKAVISLNIIIYGSPLLSDPLEEWLSDNALFLQETLPDLFELLNEKKDLAETEAPPAVLTPLYRYNAIYSTFCHD